MIILKAEKLKKLLKCLANYIYEKIYIIYFSIFSFLLLVKKKKIYFKAYKIGFLYNYGTNENFIFDDPDYTYSTNTYKLQAFYKLGNWKSLDFELIVQPQIQFIKHQLLNKWYVTPDQDNYEEKIDEFTKPKKMNLYGLEFGFAAKKKFLINFIYKELLV